MKQLINFVPLVAFFIFYKLGDIFVASAALMISSTVALALTLLIYRKVDKMTLVTFTVVMIFGALTLAFHKGEFIKWKVSIIYAASALALLYSQFVTKQTLIQKMFGKEVTLPATTWKKLNFAWTLFFFACSLANIYVAFWLPETIWVNFKVFGLTGLTLVFTLLSVIYIYRNAPSSANNTDD